MKNIYYGIVEGFFSEPLPIWTFEERLKTLEFIHQYAPNIDTYFYCPKDELYVTKKWDILYPQSKQVELSAYIQKCLEYKMDFVYGLNPSIQGTVDWDSIQSKTIKKIDQIISLGCQNVCLLFDDIPMAYDVVDNTIQASDIYDELVRCIQALYSKYEKILDDFWVCLPDYVFTQETPLTQACKNLNKKIGIIWSGNNVFSKTITNRDIERVKKILVPEVRLLYWSNYPVNDCEQAVGTFNLGGFYPINDRALKKLSGILVNPMREAYANLPFYVTFSDFIKENAQYTRNSAWTNALKQLRLSYNEIEQLTLFSSVNVNDISKKFQTYQLLKFKISPLKVSNIWGMKFTQAIKSIFVDAQLYRNLTGFIMKDRPIDRELFEQWDWFPTKTYIPRYLSEILAIVKKRYQVYGKYLIESNPFIEEDIVDQYVRNKYTGQRKLLISPDDKTLILQCIYESIRKERDLFMEFLKRDNVSADKKAFLLYARRNINRFSYD